MRNVGYPGGRGGRGAISRAVQPFSLGKSGPRLHQDVNVVMLGFVWSTVGLHKFFWWLGGGNVSEEMGGGGDWWGSRMRQQRQRHPSTRAVDTPVHHSCAALQLHTLTVASCCGAAAPPVSTAKDKSPEIPHTCVSPSNALPHPSLSHPHPPHPQTTRQQSKTHALLLLHRVQGSQASQSPPQCREACACAFARPPPQTAPPEHSSPSTRHIPPLPTTTRRRRTTRRTQRCRGRRGCLRQWLGMEGMDMCLSFRPPFLHPPTHPSSSSPLSPHRSRWQPSSWGR